jgi:catechol 2,3-dioxygenase-like lactoylglutathione lyase family enzyme
MSTSVLGLRTQGYIVPDLQAAKEWYAKAFQQEPYFDEPFYVGFNIGGYELGLMPAEGELNPGNTAFTYWGVDDIHQVFAHFLALGAREREIPHGVGGPLMVATVFDPWDNIIGFIYNPEFKPQ